MFVSRSSSRIHNQPGDACTVATNRRQDAALRCQNSALTFDEVHSRSICRAGRIMRHRPGNLDRRSQQASPNKSDWREKANLPTGSRAPRLGVPVNRVGVRSCEGRAPEVPIAGSPGVESELHPAKPAASARDAPAIRNRVHERFRSYLRLFAAVGGSVWSGGRPRRRVVMKNFALFREDHDDSAPRTGHGVDSGCIRTVTVLSWVTLITRSVWRNPERVALIAYWPPRR